MMKQLDVIGLGANAIEQIATLRQFPAPGSLTMCPSRRHQVVEGGTVGNVLTGLARLGLRTGYMGKLSGDHFGMLLTKSCINEGIDLTHCEIVPSGQAAQYWTLEDGKNQQMQLFFPNILTQIDETYITGQASYLKSCRTLVIEASGIPLASCILATEIAKSEEIPVILNFNIAKIEILDVLKSGTEQELEELIAFSDFLVLPQHVAQSFSPHKNLEECANALRAQYLIPGVILHHYTDGYLVATEDETLHVPALEGMESDQIGFNDVFLTGLAYGVNNDRTIRDAVAVANAYGALNAPRPGTRAGMKSQEDIEQFLAEYA